MKKLIAVLLAVMLVLSVSVMFVSAEDAPKVFVTIADGDGKLAVTAEQIDVTDADADSALTVNDVMIIAHEKFYQDGAAGYSTDVTQYGTSINRLWGVEREYNYSFYVNNELPMTNVDKTPVVDGDYVAAFSFTDLEKFSDKYSYFDRLSEEINAGDVTLTLSRVEFDQDFNPVAVPVEGAVITVDGKATGAATAADGKATVSLTVNGKHIVSAIAPEGQVNMPPVFVAEVTGGTDPVIDPTTETEEPTEEPTEDATEEIIEDATEDVTESATEETVAPTDAATKDSATKDQATGDSATKDSSSSTSAKTGDNTHGELWALITLISICGMLATVMIYKKRYEK